MYLLKYDLSSASLVPYVAATAEGTAINFLIYCIFTVNLLLLGTLLSSVCY